MAVASDITVTIDQAESLGLMGYPPILHQYIGVELLEHGVRHSDGITGRVSQHGKCISVGPLGFMIEWSHERRVANASNTEELTWHASVVSRRFYPWDRISIVWDTEETPMPGFERPDSGHSSALSDPESSSTSAEGL